MIEVSFTVGLLIGALLGHTNVNNGLHRQGYQRAVYEECREVRKEFDNLQGKSNDLKNYVTWQMDGCEEILQAYEKHFDK
jgi:hypothetical protein